jgi:hypothetical protein
MQYLEVCLRFSKLGKEESDGKQKANVSEGCLTGGPPAQQPEDAQTGTQRGRV